MKRLGLLRPFFSECSKNIYKRIQYPWKNGQKNVSWLIYLVSCTSTSYSIALASGQQVSQLRAYQHHHEPCEKCILLSLTRRIMI